MILIVTLCFCPQKPIEFSCLKVTFNRLQSCHWAVFGFFLPIISVLEDVKMIVSLKVENFRSLKNELIFELKGSSSSHLSDHLIPLAKSGESIVRTVGIYGPNASGKSNLLKVFSALNYIVEDTSSLKSGEEIACYEPYSLCQKNKSEPVKFEIDFIIDGLKYRYKIHFIKAEILYESLDCFYSKQPSNLFVRESDGWENIKFGAQFKGGVKKIPFGKNNSYLSRIGIVPEAPEVAINVFNYFRKVICSISMNSSFSVMHLDDEEFREVLLGFSSNFLSLIGTGVSSVKIVENKNLEIRMPDDVPEEVKKRILMDNKFSYKFEHDTEEGDCADIDIDDESSGTRRLFELAPALMSALFSHRVLVIDEIDHSMHPHLASLIIKLFNDSEINKENSQLIFTTHNIDLMKSDKMRRDQIWFSEKKKGTTNLFSLDDFDKERVKANSPFDKWYDEGRFGGIPAINFSKVKSFLLDLSEDNSQEEPDVNLFGDIDDIPEELR